MPDSVLVTGAAGFVGANLTRRLIAEGERVHLIVGPASSLWRLADYADGATVWTAPLEDYEQVAQIVRRAQPRRIFHLAAHGAYPSQRDVRRIVHTNVVGTMNLVEACLRQGFGAMVNTGSSSEYGYRADAPSETAWLDPNSHYAVSKAAATLYCRYSSLSNRVPITTLRLYSVYGPWEEPSRLMPTLITRGMRGEWPPLVSPAIARDFVYVDDVVDACLLAGQEGVPAGSVLNVATGRQTSLGELVSMVRSIQSVAAEPSWRSMVQRAWDTDVWVGDPRQIESTLGWRATTSLEAGYRKFLAWMCSGTHAGFYDPVESITGSTG